MARLACLMLIAGMTTVAYAGPTGGPYSLEPLDINGGGETASGGVYTIASSTGQSGGVDGAVDYGGLYTLDAGFWPAAMEAYQHPLAGDMNCDGVVNGQDIDGFVLALFDPAGYAAQYPDCDILNGDMNGDGLVNGQDIDGFVAVLFGG